MPFFEGKLDANLGVRKIRVLTNNPRKVKGLEGFGLQIVEIIEPDSSAVYQFIGNVHS